MGRHHNTTPQTPHQGVVYVPKGRSADHHRDRSFGQCPKHNVVGLYREPGGGSTNNGSSAPSAIAGQKDKVPRRTLTSICSWRYHLFRSAKGTGSAGQGGNEAPRGPTLGPLQRKVFVRLRPGDPAPSGPPLGPLRRSVEPPVRRGSGTRGANPGAPAARRLCSSTPRGSSTQWATTGAPDAFCGATSVRRGSGTQGANPGAPAAQRRGSSAPRGSSTQWATAGAPEAPCGKEWWTRQGKEPPTKPGWAESRITVRSQCSVNHPGHHAGARATYVNHDGAHATREAHTTRNQQVTRPAHARPTELGSVCGGRPGQHTEEQGTWASHTRKRSEAGCGQPEDGGVWTAKTVKRQPLQQPAQPQGGGGGWHLSLFGGASLWECRLWV